MSDVTAIQLDRLFHPKTVAVVGASPDADPDHNFGGKAFIEGLVGLNFRGKIYPAHPKAESVLGHKAYKSVLDTPDEVRAKYNHAASRCSHPSDRPPAPCAT